MEYLSEDQKQEFRENNKSIREQKETEQRVEEVTGALKQIRKTLLPNPLSVAGKTIEKISGRSVTNIIVKDGILRSHRNYLQRRSAQQKIIDFLTGRKR